MEYAYLIMKVFYFDPAFIALAPFNAYDMEQMRWTKEEREAEMRNEMFFESSDAAWYENELDRWNNV